jgi:hypothetical protein
MLSLPVITADSNACRHPTNEVINPVAPDRIPAAPPVSAQIGVISHLFSILIANNSQ